MENEFNIERDNELIRNGTHFWCETCLVARPIEDCSPDRRYCQSCYDFLCAEKEIFVETHPRSAPQGWFPSPGHKPTVGLQGLEVLSPSDSLVDKTQPTGGRPKIPLPEEKIKEMHAAGMGAKAIAGRLKAEGFNISYRTIYRYLKERKNENQR
jgi:hypothetical protein